jgi:hypothetical protein
MASSNITSAARESAAQRRDRRETLVDEHVAAITLRLRALATEGGTIEQARIVRDRYARVLGLPVGVGGDTFAEFMTTAEAAELDIEEIDERFIALAALDPDTHAAGAIREAMRTIGL